MSKNKKPQTIRFDQFKKQLAEVGVDELQKVELSADSAIYVRLGINLGGDPDEFDAFMEAIGDADDPEDICKLILGFYPDATAEDQLEAFRQAGGEPHELVALWGSATSARRDELGKLRPRRS